MQKPKFSVLIYPLAEEDLNEILDYLSSFSLMIANSFIEKVSSSLEQLESLPETHSLVLDKKLREKGYRYIVLDNYLIFYVIVENTVQIRRILFGRRNYKNLL